MKFSKKTIFLSNNEKNKGIAILTLENKNPSIFGTIKFYNNNLTGDLVLGIKSDTKIIKQNINPTNNTYTFILSEKINLDNTIGCVLLKKLNNEFEPILWGSEKNENYKNKIINSLQESMSKLSSMNMPTSQKTTNQTSISPIKHETINSEIPTSRAKEDIQPNSQISATDDTAYSPIYNYNNLDLHHKPQEEYAQISLSEELLNSDLSEDIAVACSSAKLFENDDSEIETLIDNELAKSKTGTHEFYNMLAEQLDEIFRTYPQEENLCKLIEGSNWAKIDTGIDNRFHVVGIIKHNNDIKYICYGVPGHYNTEPPTEMRAYSQWLPADTLDPFTKGYWVMYQDADTGENIIVN